MRSILLVSTVVALAFGLPTAAAVPLLIESVHADVDGCMYGPEWGVSHTADCLDDYRCYGTHIPCVTYTCPPPTDG